MPKRILFSAFFLCAQPSPGLARQVSHVYYLEIRGEAGIRDELLARLESRPCFEEADLHPTETYATDKERGGECHAFRRFRRSSDQRHIGHYLLRIEVKEAVRGRRRCTLRGYVITARKLERVFDTGTSEFPEARFVKEAANEIAVRTFQLRPEPERTFEPVFPD